MSVWNTIRSLFEARDPLTDLLRYVTRRYGEHQADEVQKTVSGWQKDPDGLKRTLGMKFMDPELDKLVGIVTHGKPDKAKKAAADKEKDDAAYGDDDRERIPGQSQDKGSGNAEPIPARPDRVGMKPNIPNRPLATVKPGEKPTHDVGTAGQNQAHPQPSQAILPALPKAAHAKKGASSIKQHAKMSPDAYFKQDDPQKLNVPGLHKPDYQGSFIGQRWSPNAFSKPDKDEPDTTKGRRDAGFGLKSIMRPGQAIGKMMRGSMRQDPSKPNNISVGPGVKWADTHDVLWAGKQYGWVTQSQFAALSGQGKIKREKPPQP